MPTLRQLRDRIKSLHNTQQITRAMKMVAGARIRRAELAMRAARPYASSIAEMLRELSSGGGNVDHPLLRNRQAATRGVLLMTADKGLCGAFNANLVRAALSFAAGGEDQASDPSRRPKIVFYTVGAKGHLMLRRSAHQNMGHWTLGGASFTQRAKEVASKISQDFLTATVDAVTLISSRFISTINQRPSALPLLPVSPPQQAPSEPGARNSFEFEPDSGGVLASLLPKYLEFTIFQALLETQASEFAARLLAMSNATDNAGKLIDELTLVMNNTRQASITKEILEIVGGAEAQKG